MRRILGALLLCAAACGHAEPKPEVAPQSAAPVEKAPPARESQSVPLFDDLGTYHHPVHASPEAQRYFDQGLRLAYAFNHEEAIRAFKRGAELDPECAMCLWGVAVALGPNINLPTDPEREKLAWETVRKAQAVAREPAEKDYVAAVARRYGNPPGPDRAALDRAYTEAMRELSGRYPDDDDAAVLFAESLMDLRPWNLWTKDQKPQPGTEEIVATLEKVLARRPDHPGANHFYIHAVEASAHPEKALEAARRLASLEPGAGHLVHMPAHIYMRTGRYEAASEANRRAIAADRAYLERTKAEGFYSMMYVAHNFQFLWAAAAMEGRSAESIGAAREVAARLPVQMLRSMERQMPGIDYYRAPPYFALVRFGSWKEVLAEPAPPEDLQLLSAAWRFARGMALSATDKLDEARSEHQALAALARSIPKDEMLGPTNPAQAIFAVAERLLAGELAARSGQADAAVRALREAAALEDALGYDEPPPWPLPARHYLGAVLLQADRAKDAEAVYREDLQRNPENGWALFGLLQALQESGSKDAAGMRRRFERAWAHADVRLRGSRF